MSRPSNPQPFAPTGSAVQYEAPHGLLKLRGGHEQPGTSAYPELDEKGVSYFSFFLPVLFTHTFHGSGLVRVTRRISRVTAMFAPTQPTVSSR